MPSIGLAMVTALFRYEEALNADGFVVAARSGVKTYSQEYASVSKDATRGATGVGENETAHTGFQKNVLE